MKLNDINQQIISFAYNSKTREEMRNALLSIKQPVQITYAMINAVSDSLYQIDNPYNEERCLYKACDREDINEYEKEAKNILEHALGVNYYETGRS